MGGHGTHIFSIFNIQILGMSCSYCCLAWPVFMCQSYRIVIAFWEPHSEVQRGRNPFGKHCITKAFDGTENNHMQKT